MIIRARWLQFPLGYHRFLDYKDSQGALFRGISRRPLFKGDDFSGELRYFEIAPEGRSTLERHEHAHAVVVLLGGGGVPVGDAVFPVKVFDLIVVPPLTLAPVPRKGRVCVGLSLHGRRGTCKPEIQDEREIARLRTIPDVASFLATTCN